MPRTTPPGSSSSPNSNSRAGLETKWPDLSIRPPKQPTDGVRSEPPESVYLQASRFEIIRIRSSAVVDQTHEEIAHCECHGIRRRIARAEYMAAHICARGVCDCGEPSAGDGRPDRAKIRVW